MEQVFNIYCLTFDQLLCLNVWMDIEVVKSDKDIRSKRESEVEDDCIGGKLQIKNACTDVTGAPHVLIYKTPENWCEFQDKILRILTYKYYDSDYALHYHHKGNYLKGSDGSPVKYYLEEEMEVFNLQEYADMSLPTIEVQAAHQFLPIQLNPENVVIHEDRFWVKTWKLMKNIFTFKSCKS